MTALLSNVLLPPPGLVLAAFFVVLLAMALRRRAWRLGALAVAASLLAGYFALSTSIAANLLLSSLEREVSTFPTPSAAPQAIVILGGDISHTPDGTDVGPLSLERLRAGAALQRRTGLPILVTGGVLDGGQVSLAELMARSLRDDFGATVRWVEPRAANTAENAAFATQMLHDAGIQSAYVVTHAWHLPRALAAFRRRGLQVAPAPVSPERQPRWSLASLMPRADYAALSWYAIRERVGQLVYALRG